MARRNGGRVAEGGWWWSGFDDAVTIASVVRMRD